MDRPSEEIIEGQWVTAFFNAEYKPVTGAERDDLSESIRCHSTHDRLGLPAPVEDSPHDLTSARELEEIPGYMLKMWNSLERKLDSLLKMASEQRHALENAAEGMAVELCRNGMKIRMGEPIPEQDHYLVRLSPPTFPAFTVDAIGKIVKNEPAEQGATCHLKFIAINADDRELLIGYIFKRQREMLRGEKDEKDN